MCIRMQPCDAAEPIEPSSDVPWIPAPSKIPIQRALIGLPGSPAGITLPARSPAQAEFGTCQAGLTALFWTWYRPAGVSRPTWPTAIPYVFLTLRFLYSVSLKLERLTMITVGYF